MDDKPEQNYTPTPKSRTVTHPASAQDTPIYVAVTVSYVAPPGPFDITRDNLMQRRIARRTGLTFHSCGLSLLTDIRTLSFEGML